MGVQTIMVTGDSPITAAAIARKVGIAETVSPQERLTAPLRAHEFSVFARVAPDEKYRLVNALQQDGHVVGMCGDGANDAPALRQAQIGIAVVSATDVAKAAAGAVLTEPALMVLMLLTNDFLAMSLTADRASLAPRPSAWHMRSITAAGLVLGVCKLGFSTAMLAFGRFELGLGVEALQTWTFATLVFGNQALLYVLRERRRMWRSKPSVWVFACSAADIAIVVVLAVSGVLMAPLPWRLVVAVFAVAAWFALLLDQVKLPI